jgi:hypothetical protein
MRQRNMAAVAAALPAGSYAAMAAPRYTDECDDAGTAKLIRNVSRWMNPSFLLIFLKSLTASASERQWR